MKVFCINDEGWIDEFWKDGAGPSYGDICTVTGEEVCPIIGPCYLLAEWTKKGDSFCKDEFIPIQEEEAIEFIEMELQNV